MVTYSGAGYGYIAVNMTLKGYCILRSLPTFVLEYSHSSTYLSSSMSSRYRFFRNTYLPLGFSKSNQSFFFELVKIIFFFSHTRWVLIVDWLIDWFCLLEFGIYKNHNHHHHQMALKKNPSIAHKNGGWILKQLFKWEWVLTYLLILYIYKPHN